MSVYLPGDTDRLSITGPTGSGKTQAAAWHLSQQNLVSKAWIIFDYKFDPLLNSIDGVREIDTSETPKKPGLYIVHPTVDYDSSGVEEMMLRIWDRENIGVYVDEAYMVNKSRNGYPMLLTQGRSKHIPMITLCQRPARVSLFTFSEATFHQIFPTDFGIDQDRIDEFVSKPRIDWDRVIPKFHSYYYDVANKALTLFKPVPDKQSILKIFDAKLNPGKRRWL